MEQKDFGRRQFLKSALLGVGASFLPAMAVGKKRPNIIFFLTDDMGWMDSTVYGSCYYETPNLERLASRSMRFTDAYSASPFCSPTRACLLTGKYPQRLRITSASCHAPIPKGPLMPEKAAPDQKMILPRSQRFLPLEEVTVAEVFKKAGYRTGHIGKWHLGHAEKYWPEKQGFEVNVAGGRWPGPPSYFSPYKISRLKDGPEGEYLADRLGKEVETFLRESKDGPFYLNFWHYSVHAPYQGKIKYRDYFEGKKDPRAAQNNAVMGAMIKSMDESLGHVLDTLDELGIADNTIIVFTSDNGGNMYDHTDREGKNLGPNSAEGRKPTNNAPLRGGKGCMYEGGIRVPLLVSWPGTIAAGSISSELVSAVDWVPTLLEMAGLEADPRQQFDGTSLLPVLRGGSRKGHAHFWHLPHFLRMVPCNPCSAVRQGDWKLIHFYVCDERFPNEYELYNLREDIGELHNLAESQPRKKREMIELLENHLRDCGALVPRPNPAYNPKCSSVVLGWHSSRDCWMEERETGLVVHSQGRDPFVVGPQIQLQAEGKLQVGIRYRSSSSGVGEFFWITDKARRYGQHQAIDYKPIHDGKWHEMVIPFTSNARLRQIRVDVSAGAGDVELASVWLCSGNGQEIKRWNFARNDR